MRPEGVAHNGIDQQIAANAAAFERLLAVVTQRLTAGRWDSASAWARVAAAFAATNPHGPLRDVRLEGALDAIARATLAQTPVRSHAASPPRHVLHVLSEAHHVGGHVRMALRWIESDDATPHAAVTRPGLGSLEVSGAVADRGGVSHMLESRSLIERARELRAIAGKADIVVCHTHPDDPVPAMAFGGGYRGAPVVMVNHADHVFWLGVGNVSVVMNLRQIGSDTTVNARGYPQENMMVVPTPVASAGRRFDRDVAQRRLGVDPDQCVLVTLARGLKYAPAPWHPGFVQVLQPALRRLPGATLVAVGADPADGAWSGLQRELPGRVIVPGPQPDPSIYLDAADIYLDSFPFGSVTSMLEAATRSVPILASRAYGGLRQLISSAGPLDDVVIPAPDVRTYHGQLRRLVQDPALRARAGADAAAAVCLRHGPDAWREHLRSVYARADAVMPVTGRSAPEAEFAELTHYARALLGIEARAPLLWTIGFSREGFDRVDRASSFVRTWVVRGAQRLTGQGAGAGATMGRILIPA